jgi:hypothetical protein
MITVDTSERAVEAVERAGGTGRRYDYIGSPGEIDTRPQAFLVERLYAGARVDPHFHDIDQFQVVVDGDCRMGKKAAPPVTFQYADAYTPYGPIAGAEQGFAFFTLRPIASGGFYPMPGNRQHMPGRAGRNIAGHFDIERPLPASGKVDRESLMAPQADKVDATGFWLGADAHINKDPAAAGGRYYLVCAGSVLAEGKSLSAGSVVHAGPGESVPALNSGAEGAAVLMLQFAEPSERPGSDPITLAKRDPNAYKKVPQGSGR